MNEFIAPRKQPDSRIASRAPFFAALKERFFSKDPTPASVTREHIDLAKEHMKKGRFDEASSSLAEALKNARCISEFSSLRQSGLLQQEIFSLREYMEKTSGSGLANKWPEAETIQK